MDIDKKANDKKSSCTKDSEPNNSKMDIEKDEKEEKKEEQIFEDVGGIQLEVYPRFDENVHISTKQKFPEKYGRDYDETLLNSTSNECEMKNGESIFVWFESID